MKKWHSIVIVFALLAILISVYSYVKLNPKQSEQESSSEQEKIKLTEFDSTSINKIQIENVSGSIKLERKDDKWIINDRNDIVTSENSINNIIDKLSSIEADLVISENTDNLSDYGLDNPSKIIVDISGDKSYTFLAGDNSPTGEGFYFINDTDTKIYMLGSMYKNIFDYTFNDLIEKEEIPTVTTENLNYVYIQKKDSTPIEIVKPDETNQYDTWHSMAAWQITSPYNPTRALSVNEAWDEVLSKMSGFNSAVKEFISNSPEDLDKYGLNSPELELILRDSDGVKTHLSFGTQATEDTVYFKQENSNSIYTMNKSVFDTFNNIDLFSITDKFTVLLNIQDVKKVVIQESDMIFEFNIEVTKQKQEGSDNETTVITCKVGDKEYPEDDFKKLYQNFISILIDAQYDGDTVSGSPDISMAFHMNDGKVVEAKYYKYNDKYYIFDREGNQNFLVDKRQFDSMFGKIDEFFNGTINQNN